MIVANHAPTDPRFVRGGWEEPHCSSTVAKSDTSQSFSVTPAAIAGVTSIVIAALGDVYLLIGALTGNAIDKAVFAGNST